MSNDFKENLNGQVNGVEGINEVRKEKARKILASLKKAYSPEEIAKIVARTASRLPEKVEVRNSSISLTDKNKINTEVELG